MPRIRYLKPEFFIDEDLKNIPFEARLFFAGLWCHADRDGRLEDRPERLKVQIMPYDKIDPEKMLTILSTNKSTGKPFIARYSINGSNYIQILQWGKHQKPHHTEKESEIPSFNGVLTVKEPLVNSEVRDAHSPFSLSSPLSLKGGVGGFDFELLWAKYPNKDGKRAAEKHFKSEVKTEQDWKDINTALDNYLQSDVVKKGFIKNGSTWFNNWRDWIVPPKKEENDGIPKQFRHLVSNPKSGSTSNQ